MFSGVISFFFLVAGCAEQQQPKPLLQRDAYPESAISALVFDPPVIAGEPPVELSRDDRRPAAFIGYEDTTATYYDVHTYDRQSTDGDNFFERSSIMDKVGVSYR